jgi:hypothetical protein
MRKTYPQSNNRKSYVVRKSIRRRPVRLIIILFLVSLVLLMSAFFARTGHALLVLALLGIATCVGALILFFQVNRCPYCGRMFRGLHWSAPDAGHCEGCGKLIQYSDTGTKPPTIAQQHRKQKQGKKNGKK